MIDSAMWNMRPTLLSKKEARGDELPRRHEAECNRKREKEAEAKEREDEREAVPAMADCRGSFNVATPVITSALTGDDSPSLFRGFTGSSSAREGPREADTQQGKAAFLSPGHKCRAKLNRRIYERGSVPVTADILLFCISLPAGVFFFFFSDFNNVIMIKSFAKAFEDKHIDKRNM